MDTRHLQGRDVEFRMAESRILVACGDKVEITARGIEPWTEVIRARIKIAALEMSQDPLGPALGRTYRELLLS